MLAVAMPLLVATLALGSSHQTASTSSSMAVGALPPNVVVVMTDDQDARSVRVMRAVESRLADRGTTFVNSFATFPLCCPSRATFLTGQYAHNHGVMDNAPPNGGYRAFEDSESLAVWMGRAGYRTGYIGRYLVGYDDRRRRRVPPGWNEWYSPVDDTSPFMFDYTLNENGRFRHYGNAARHYQTDVYRRKAADFIRRRAPRSAPFFLTVAPLAPHDERGRPPRPAPRHRGAFDGAQLPRRPSFNEDDVSDKPSFVRTQARLDRHEREKLTRLYRARLASLLAVDEMVRGIVDQLRRAGELDDTLMIFTSDNGYLLGEHRLTKKTVLYEESAGVPLIIRGPGVPEGSRRGQIVGNIDLAPTILDAANAEPPGLVMDGRSLLRPSSDSTLEDGRDMLLENMSSEAVRTPDFMYAEHPGGEVELYDLTRDPFQLESRHRDESYNDIQRQLEERLAQLRGCEGEQCR